MFQPVELWMKRLGLIHFFAGALTALLMVSLHFSPDLISQKHYLDLVFFHSVNMIVLWPMMLAFFQVSIWSRSEDSKALSPWSWSNLILIEGGFLIMTGSAFLEKNAFENSKYLLFLDNAYFKAGYAALALGLFLQSLFFLRRLFRKRVSDLNYHSALSICLIWIVGSLLSIFLLSPSSFKDPTYIWLGIGHFSIQVITILVFRFWIDRLSSVSGENWAERTFFKTTTYFYASFVILSALILGTSFLFPKTFNFAGADRILLFLPLIATLAQTLLIFAQGEKIARSLPLKPTASSSLMLFSFGAFVFVGGMTGIAFVDINFLVRMSPTWFMLGHFHSLLLAGFSLTAFASFSLPSSRRGVFFLGAAALCIVTAMFSASQTLRRNLYSNLGDGISPILFSFGAIFLLLALFSLALSPGGFKQARIETPPVLGVASDESLLSLVFKAKKSLSALAVYVLVLLILFYRR